MVLVLHYLNCPVYLDGLDSGGSSEVRARQIVENYGFSLALPEY
jgi:hypothetical protein